MNLSDLSVQALFDLSQTQAASLLGSVRYPWEALPGIKDLILEIGPLLPRSEYEQVAAGIWIARDACVAPSASITGPTIIGHETEVRHCAFIRGNSLVGQNCVVGNSTELKNVILMNKVQVPHFNYVGDSILGYKSHLGAGAITSNVKGDHSPVIVRINGETLETGLRKFGAILGDGAEIGCNSVLNPGSVVGRNCQVYPLSMVRGFVPANSIYKIAGEIIAKK